MSGRQIKWRAGTEGWDMQPAKLSKEQIERRNWLV